MNNETIYQVSIMTIGSKDTGKTCLIKRFCKERFDRKYITTIGLDYGVNKFDIHGRKVAVCTSKLI